MMTRSRRALLALFALTTLLAAGLAVADGRRGAPAVDPVAVPDAREVAEARLAQARISGLLDMIHELPAKARFEEASPRARDIVWAIARDEVTIGPRRYAALEAMAYYWHSPEVERYLLGELAQADTPEGLRHRLLMWIADTSSPARATATLEPYLKARDIALRLTATDALGRVDEGKALALLRHRAEHAASALERKRAEQAARHSPVHYR